MKSKSEQCFVIFFALTMFCFTSCKRKQLIWSSEHFTRQDSLRGHLNTMRSCIDVFFYDLDIHLNLEERKINGVCTILSKFVHESERIQLDLFENMIIDSIFLNHNRVSYVREGNAFFLDLKDINLHPTHPIEIKIAYHGHPHRAKNPPWDGGFVWDYDDSGNVWMGVACEGLGASSWWPNKDHLSDEPDSMLIQVHVDSTYLVVSNGQLLMKEVKNNIASFLWKVSYPINNYNVTVNVGKFEHFSDTLYSPKGKLPLDYYVLPYNLSIAKQHFIQTKDILRSFEEWFGPYPFWRDGYCLVETPYLGMEHQSAIAYGNNYKRGYSGYLKPDILDFDYIILHETGHEYWGNSVSCKDLADVWIHEAFTTYMESLYVEDHYGYKIALEYLKDQRRRILNDKPIVGTYDVNHEESLSTDAYFKGTWILHTLRNILGEEVDWKKLLRSIYEDHKYTNTTTDEIIASFSHHAEKDLSNFFEHYLYQTHVPIFEYKWKTKNKMPVLKYRWTAVSTHFDMPIELINNSEPYRLHPSTKWQKKRLPAGSDKNLEINTEGFLFDFRAL